jgi:hypothetical protein
MRNVWTLLLRLVSSIGFALATLNCQEGTTFVPSDPATAQERILAALNASVVLGTLLTTQTGVGFQAGGGFGFGVTKRISFRVTGDYRQPFSDAQSFARQIRGAASIVVGIGNR